MRLQQFRCKIRPKATNWCQTSAVRATILSGHGGGRVRDSEGSQSYRDAGVSHRTAIARLDANVRQDGETLTGRFQADGAVVAMGGNVYFANRIDDSFGVVSAGTAGVKVTQDNRIVGETDENGKLLVPNLRSHGVKPYLD